MTQITFMNVTAAFVMNDNPGEMKEPENRDVYI